MFSKLLVLSILVSCQSEKANNSTSKEELTTKSNNEIDTKSSYNTKNSSTDSSLVSSIKIDPNYLKLFNKKEWIALKNDKNLAIISERCSKCWHDHDYSPFKVVDTIQTTFLNKKTNDTIVKLVSISNLKLKNLSDVLNFENETIFHKELTVLNKGVIIGDWLQIGISIDEIIEHIGQPDFNNNNVIYYQKADNHIWFISFKIKNTKVEKFRIGHYST